MESRTTGGFQPGSQQGRGREIRRETEERAYQRSDLLAARRELMEAWGRHIPCRHRGHEVSQMSVSAYDHDLSKLNDVLNQCGSWQHIVRAAPFAPVDTSVIVDVC